MEVKCASRTASASSFHGYDDHPSFSSTLLDSIYRSIDESSHDIRQSSRSRSQSRTCAAEEEFFLEEMLSSGRIGGNSKAAAGLMMKSSSASVDRRSRTSTHEERKSRDRVFDRWMQNEDLVVRRRSLPPETSTEFSGLRSSSDRRRSLGSMKSQYSPPSSSESSSNGRYSSYADSDFLCTATRKTKSSSLNSIRTSVSDPTPPKSKSGGKSAKSRAMKLYGDLKRMKQPISPGGKLASFLNSLFNANSSSKKQKISSSSTTTATTPSCSTASSYSRSCLSKRPSSADCVKRSVRFCPVNVVFSEDSSRSSRKTVMAVDEKRRVEEMARDILRNYQHKKELEARKDDEDDDESCCSSDLFELEIGVDRYSTELPVYETTRVDTNRTIASRMMMK